MVFILAGLIGITIGSLAIGFGWYKIHMEYRRIFGELHAQLYSEVHHAWGKQDFAEKKLKALEEEKIAQAKAIEAGSLPWFAKNDKLEARFEADAIDKLDNPQVDYQDVVAGLGGTN